MIQLTRFNGRIFYLNAEMIKTIEATPDTVVTLINGEKLIVKDSVNEIVKKFIYYKRAIQNLDLNFEAGE